MVDSHLFIECVLCLRVEQFLSHPPRVGGSGGGTP
ncbi:hypothetical protein cce_5285 (plasmid) [Crocosphaera subtropica ATCC 51142]|uniref:Uncharacterized protein n=1 Tax=Crocosphaera subtropica (strain ATCC 51142 / BH68) TaxID=43989 RepID=B1X3C0_CROS5|nr:hypothetical protein cce_5285 [Crocosphaera subtropica ATCC 51142]